jgi:hypothetical protein
MRWFCAAQRSRARFGILHSSFGCAVERALRAGAEAEEEIADHLDAEILRQ